MALYKATNIIPSLMNSTEDGTVDAREDLTISWQVNGPSPMEDCILRIYDMTMEADDFESRLIYESPWIEEGCPFYGRDSLGEIQRYSHTIPNSELPPVSDGKGYGNGRQYSLVITQWYEERLSLYDVERHGIKTGPVSFQTAYPATFVRKSGYDPTDPQCYTITAREKTFDFLSFTDTNLQWFRWVLSINDGDIQNPIVGDTIYDTGKIYGSGDLSLYYSGFINGVSYVLQCTARDRYGRPYTSDLHSFIADYEQITMDFPIAVTPSQTKSAIRVEWKGAFTIPGVPTGKYKITAKDNLRLYSTDDYVTWDTVSERPMDFDTPWTLMYKGKLNKADAILWELGASNSSDVVSLVYTHSTRTLKLKKGSTVLQSYSPIWWESTISTILVVPENGDPTFYLRIDYMTGGLYPSETLYPADDLYPQEDTMYVTDKTTDTLTGVTFSDITSVRVYGTQLCYFLEVMITNEELLPAIVKAMYDKKASKPISVDGLVFYATFEAGLNAGSLYYFGKELSGWAIYRTEENDQISEPMALLPVSATGFYDYTARTDGTKYLYEIAPVFVGEEGHTTGTAIRSDTPFGIKNSVYSIIECVYDEERECYIALKEFDFDKNVKTGQVSNNNKPSVLPNFTKYPTVQLAPQNYKSGNLSSLIGVLNLTEYSEINYMDTRQQRDAIYELSITTNPLFLKTRKGDILKIRISDAIGMTSMDNTLSQAQEVSISWVEVGSLSNKEHIVSYEDIEHSEDYYEDDTGTPIIPTGTIPIKVNGLYEIRQYAQANVNVPNTYSDSDQGKVVNGNVLEPQTSMNVESNGTYDTTLNNEVVVDVPNTYTAEDQGKVVSGDGLVSQTTTNIGSNGTFDTTLNNSAVVNVPNTYGSADQGKVVSGNALVAQTSKNIGSNGTYDTTQNNSVIVNVPNTYTASDEGKVVQNGTLVSQTTLIITESGTYDTTAYNSVVINIPAASGEEF